MTTTTGTVYEFDIPDEPRTAANTPHMDFTINGEPYTLLMPKIATTAGMLALIADATDVDIMQNGARFARAMLGMVDYIVDVPPEPQMIDNPAWRPDGPDGVRSLIPNPKAGQLRGKSRILQRLDTPADPLDLPSLAPIFKTCVQVLMGRPTGPAPASSPQQASAGSDSAEGSSEQPAATF